MFSIENQRFQSLYSFVLQLVNKFHRRTKEVEQKTTISEMRRCGQLPQTGGISLGMQPPKMRESAVHISRADYTFLGAETLLGAQPIIMFLEQRPPRPA